MSTQPETYETFDPNQIPDVLPVLPLQESVLFPYIIVPLSIGPDASIQAVERALAEQRIVLLCTQKENVESPSPEHLEPIGTAALVMRMLKLPDGRVRILVQGLARARATHFGRTTPFLEARIEILEDTDAAPTDTADAQIRSIKENLERAVSLGKDISSEVMVIATNLEEPGRLADLIASNLDIAADEAHKILKDRNPLNRLKTVNALLTQEVLLLEMQHEITTQARDEIDRGQREFFLRQQLRTIQEALGEGDDLAEDVAAYRKAAKARGIEQEALEEMERQIRRLERTHPDSAESSVIRTYLDWLTGLPWNQGTEDDLDLARAKTILDQDHFDLEKVKQRMLEFLAVRKLKPDAKGPILCLVGPPGVGKTSLGRSIARALGREFIRLSLGGVRDEAEIRGHRRTYVGALPGRILQGLHQVGVGNPVFMLDEIDKVGADYRGDPSSALLEVLDPEQNHSFRDHYLGVGYDLSKVLFITTANLLDPIQPAFRDRMEIIRIPGYTREEKVEIAKRHLIPKQIEENGLTKSLIRFTPKGLHAVLDNYTRESGVRSLERELGALCRKVAMEVATREPSSAGAAPTGALRGASPTGAPTGASPTSRQKPTSIDAARVALWLGPPRHYSEHLLDRDRIGVATGLAWTAAGGDLLLVETTAVPGKGKLVLTGQLGEVMRESAQAALSFARGNAGALLATNPPTRSRKRTSKPLAPDTTFADFFAHHDIHIHVPAGSVPKDGPSAGITIATALMSLLSERAVKRQVAMTGELTLRGEVMPIGGLREKLLAAVNSGVKQVLIPEANRRDLEDITADIGNQIEVLPVQDMAAVIQHALRAR